MTSSVVLNESTTSQLEPVVTIDNIIVPHSTPTDESTLQFIIREDEYTQIENSKALLIYSQDELVYHFLEESLHNLLNNDIQQEFTLLYDKDKEPLWKLVGKDWHGMTLQYLKDNTTILLSNISPQFKFTLNQQDCYWQIMPLTESPLYSLACYNNNTQLIATFKTNQLSILNQLHPHDTSFLCLSALLVNYHVKYLLKSLGNKPEVIQMMLHDNNPYASKNRMSTTTTPSQRQLEQEEEEDEIASLSSIMTKNNHYYPGHHNLVNSSTDNRWSSSAQSFKSIELDPGFWHCYWGYKFWWSWFPCCMPGGCIDRGCIRLKGGYKSRKPSRTLSKQGYQQQHY